MSGKIWLSMEDLRDRFSVDEVKIVNIVNSSEIIFPQPVTVFDKKMWHTKDVKHWEETVRILKGYNNKWKPANIFDLNKSHNHIYGILLKNNSYISRVIFNSERKYFSYSISNGARVYPISLVAYFYCINPNGQTMTEPRP